MSEWAVVVVVVVVVVCVCVLCVSVCVWGVGHTWGWKAPVLGSCIGTRATSAAAKPGVETSVQHSIGGSGPPPPRAAQARLGLGFCFVSPRFILFCEGQRK